jgi:hypothetical protein
MILDAMETTQRRALDAGDISEEKNEEVEEEGAVEGEPPEEPLLRDVSRIGTREKIEVPMYEGNLEVEELLDWVCVMDKYFDYE